MNLVNIFLFFSESNCVFLYWIDFMVVDVYQSPIGRPSKFLIFPDVLISGEADRDSIKADASYSSEPLSCHSIWMPSNFFFKA